MSGKMLITFEINKIEHIFSPLNKNNFYTVLSACLPQNLNYN